MANEYDALVKESLPTSVNEYDAVVSESVQDDHTTLRQSMTAAAAGDPQRHARAVDYASRLNLPVGTVERNLDEVTQRDVVERNDYDRLLRETPATANFLKDSTNATIAKDDVDRLSMIEKILDAGKRGFLTLRQTPYAAGIMANRKLAENSEANFASIESRLAAGESPNTIPDSEDLYGIRFMSAAEREQFKDQLRSSFASGTGEQITRLAHYEAKKRAIPTDPEIAAAMQSHTFPEFWQHFTKKPAEFILTVGAESLPSSAPGIIAAVPAGIAAGPLGVAGAIGANSFATDYASSVMEALQNEGVDLTDEKAVHAAVLDKELMGRVGQQAFAHATIVGSVDAFSGGIAGKTLIPKRVIMHQGARELANVAAQAPVQGTLGALGEAGGEAAAGQDMQPGNIASEFFGEFATAPVEVASASSSRVLDQVREARQGKQNERMFLALGDGVQNSETFKRLPLKIQELVEAATKDGPIETLYVPIESWQTYWQSQNADPAAIAGELTGDKQAYQEALATGKDLAIPTARYATKLAPTDHNKFFAREIRLSPDGMTANEADAFEKELKAQAEQQKPQAGSAQSVREDVLGQLLGLGFERSTAEAYADLYEQAFGTLGARAGIDPLELFNQYGLNIERPAPDVLQKAGNLDALDVMIDRLRTGDIPTERETHGPSLLDFLVEKGGLQDEGGELAARDAKKARRGLVRDSGMALDHASELAVEAGYMTERDPNKLLDLISEGLGGKETYAPGRGNATLFDLQARLDQLEQYLRQLGIDLNETDNATIKRLLRAESETPGDATMFQQVMRGIGQLLGRKSEKAPNVTEFSQLAVEPSSLADYLGRVETERADKVKQAGLVVGMQTKDGRVVAGNPGQQHFHVMQANQADSEGAAFGYVDNAGKFYTRAQAQETFRVSDSSQLGELAPDQPVVYFQREKRAQGEPYQADLFGRSLPKSNRKRPARTERGDVQSPVAIRALKTSDKAPGIYAVETALVSEHTRNIPLEVVETPAQAAQALAYLTHYAVEHLDALVTDQNGKPLAIVGSFKGTINGTAVYPATVMNEAIRVAGAANIWFSHNHPSGNSSFSRADITLWNRLREMFEPTKIKPRGMFAIAGTGNTRNYDFADAHGNESTGQTTRAPDKVGVPVVERVYVNDEKLGNAIEAPGDALPAVEGIAGEDPGIVFLDNRHSPVGFMPISPAHARSLRKGGRIDQLYRSVSRVNAAAAFIANPRASYSERDVYNLAAALRPLDIRLLDVIDYAPGEYQRSWSESGRELDDGRTKFLQRAADTKRGAVSFGPDRQFTIKMFEKADLSTFLHESGHFYLEILGDLAERTGAGEQLRDDYATILKWLGAETRGAITTEQHEKFARGFEAYLMEGKAPSAELRSAFAKFRAWLVAVYRTIVRLNVELTDEVRAVMDRMVATEDAIAAAEQEGGVEAMFATADDAGMTETEFAAYRKTVEAASEGAREKLHAKLMHENRRQQEKWWKGARAKIRDEVAAEVNALPEYRAAAFLVHGTNADGSALAEGVLPFKLDRKAIVDAYGVDFAKRLPRGAMTAEGGLHTDHAAESLGFQSGEQLVMALANLRPRDPLIDAETDARLRDRYGDMLLDGSALAAAAQNIVEGPTRAKVIEAELKALRKKAREVEPHIRAAETVKKRDALATIRGTTLPIGRVQAIAEGMIAQTRVRDLNPGAYLVAIRRAARQAIEAAAAGDYRTAAFAKQRELLNLELYRAATEARDEVDAIASYMGKFSRTAARERLGKAGADYLAQIDGLLERFEFRRVSNAELERRQALAEWIRQKEQNGESLGEEISIPEQIKNDAYRVNYRELTVETLRGVNDAVHQIEHFARLKNKLLASQGKRERDEARAELVLALESNLKDRGPPPLTKSGLTKMQALGKRVAAFDASLMKMEQLVDWLDGGDINGPWHKYFWDGAAEAQKAELDYSKKITARIAKAVMNVPVEIRRRMLDRVEIPGIDRVITRKDLIGVALNVGNESNRAKLLKGMQWNQAQLDQMLGRLTKPEWDFVQSVWDTLESLWPDIAALQKELTGLEPEKIAATPVQTAHGTYAGGYYPVMYDPIASEQGALQLGARVGDMIENGYTRATTPKGHTKARVEGFARPFNLDIDDLPGHIAGVVKDLTHRKWLIDANWIAHDKDVRAALRRRLGDEYVQLFPDWVRQVANDRNFASLRSLNIWRRMIEHLRYNVMIAAMGFKSATMSSQLAGIGPSIEVIGGDENDGAKYLTRAFGDVMRHPRTVYEMATSLSGELRHRLDNRDRDLRDKLRLLQGREDWFAKLQDFALHGIAWADMMVSLPTWLAGYQKALDQGKDRDTAVKAGDRAVRLSQGSGGAKDLASVMTRNDTFMRVITMFYTPFNALYNRLRDTGHSVNGIRDVPQAALRLWWLWLVPAVMGELLAGHGPSDKDDDDWWKWLLKTELLYPTLSVPFLRDVAGGAFGDYGYQLSPVAQAGDSVAKTLRTAGGVATGDKDVADLGKTALKTSGYLLGLPTGQVQITGGYLYDVASGEENPDDLADFMYHVFYRRKRE